MKNRWDYFLEDVLGVTQANGMSLHELLHTYDDWLEEERIFHSGVGEKGGGSHGE